jgi:hypothetical protein
MTVRLKLAVRNSNDGARVDTHLGASLLQDGGSRTVAVSQNAGVRALLVHALHERTRQFYEHYGFQPSPTHPMTLMLRLSAVREFRSDRRVPMSRMAAALSLGGLGRRKLSNLKEL